MVQPEIGGHSSLPSTLVFFDFAFSKLFSSSMNAKIDDDVYDGEFRRKHFAKLILLFDDDGKNLNFNHIILFRFSGPKFGPGIKIDYEQLEC